MNATDANGKPVIGMPVRFFVNPERTGRWLETTATTGADGRAVFADLPPSLKGWIDPAPHREGLGNPGWVDIELPASGEKVHPPSASRRQDPARTGPARRDRRAHRGRARFDELGLPPVSPHGRRRQVRIARLDQGTAQHPARHRDGIRPWCGEFTEAGVPDIGLLPGVTLRGRVVDETGEVVVGALVSVARIGGGAAPSMGSAVTDAEGAVRGGRAGLAGQGSRGPSAGRGRLVQVIAHGAKQDLGDLVLPACCEVMGTLTDSAGAPMARIPVTLTPSENFDHALRRLERRTDDLGRFRFPDVGPAAYDLGSARGSSRSCARRWS